MFTHYISRLSLMTMALICATSSAIAATSLKFPQSDAATIGITVINLADGSITAQENAGKAMIPASTMKCVTSAAALLTLPTDFRFQTPVRYSGTIDGSTLWGDIVIEASADPTINSRHFPEYPSLIDEIITALRDKGVKRITGDIIIDEEKFADPGLNPQWTVGDAGEAYGAGLYGFNYYDNTFTLRPADMTTSPKQPFIDVVLEPSQSAIEVVHGVNSDTYIISGRGLDRTPTIIELPMNNPSSSFVAELRQRLFTAGISIDESNSTDGDLTPLFIHHSPTSIEILRSLMQRSDNMMAEAMLRVLAPDKTRTEALTAERDILQEAGIDMSLTKIVDGSGLARMDRLTPLFLARLLETMAKSVHSDDYISLFAISGKTGTVKNFLKKTPLDGRMALKSGSINGVHCYAGYRLDADGRPTHAVVVMVNNFYCSRDAVRSAISKWLVEELK